jgi:GT2 family glycosyltransferase
VRDSDALTERGARLDAQPTTDVDVSVVIVSWNVRDLLRACIASVSSEQPDLSIQILVVDNDSRDGSAQMVREEFPAVELVTSDVNLGFSRANNLALARAMGRYVFFLNPDTIVRRGTLRHMVAFLDKHGDIDIVGPKILSGDGTVQPIARPPSPSILPMLLQALYLHRLAAVGRRRTPRTTTDDSTTSHEVHAVSGAAIFGRRDVISDVGGFDEGFLYTCEDADLCLRVRARGRRIHYLPRAEIVHLSGRSSEQASVRAITASFLSMQRYLERWHGRFPAWSYRVIIQGLQMPLMIAVGVAKILLHKERLEDLQARLELARVVWAWRVGD